MNEDKLEVLGFFFNRDMTQVALIQKKKPVWQAGLYNGIGGKRDGEEQPMQAMIREFEEETGHLAENWEFMLTMVRAGESPLNIFVFRGISLAHDIEPLLRTAEDETVRVFGIDDLPRPEECISNVHWLVYLMMDMHQTRGSYRIRGRVGTK